MGSFLLLLMGSFLAVDRYELKASVTFDPVPEEAEEFLRSPADVALDARGRAYLLDIGATSVFVWDEKGNYVNRFGRQGQGPGEFSFQSNFGGAQGYISIVEERIYVYDGGNKTVLAFDLDFNYIKSFPMQMANGRIEQFRVMPNGDFLIFHSSYFADEPYRRAAIFSQAGEERRVLKQIPDETWYYTTENGQQRVTLVPYATSLYIDYQPATKQIVMGDTGAGSFQLLRPDGSTVREVAFDVPRGEVTQADINDYKDQRWFKSQQFFKVSFPKLRPYYNRLIHLGDRGFLMYVQTVGYRHCDGFWLDEKGAVQGRFKREAGPRGGLYGAGNRILGVTTDEEGEFALGFLDPVLKSDT